MHTISFSGICASVRTQFNESSSYFMAEGTIHTACMHTHAHTYVSIHTHVYAHAHTSVHTLTQTHTSTHTHTHKHTRSHRHRHTFKQETHPRCPPFEAAQVLELWRGVKKQTHARQGLSLHRLYRWLWHTDTHQDLRHNRLCMKMDWWSYYRVITIITLHCPWNQHMTHAFQQRSRLVRIAIVLGYKNWEAAF